ncbi:hypothetical protein NA57DRAFT_51638 [Rhizodiscina lignyota]|uniref:Uncharacterized protein n=1 Tax=Rhizodiscina lignyota TaxID=1504668 RepID=A0A9P4IS49_9PEZI|nr:hypothetical protein NA57DRAFT_51638 [Rhizodiscina lignyota]
MTSFGGLNINLVLLARGTATLLSALGIFGGIRAITSPSAFATTFGFPQSTSAVTSADSNPFIIVAGGRQIAGGLGLLACAYFKCDRALGLLMMTGVVAGGIDGWVLLNYLDPIKSNDGEDLKRERERVESQKASGYAHWVFNSVYAALGAWVAMRPEV